MSTSTKWKPDNPANGQCAVTALVFQDHYGGDIVKTRVGGQWHFYNVLGGERVDMTAEQFSAPVHYSDTPSSRSDAFTNATEAQYTRLSGQVRLKLSAGTGDREESAMSYEPIRLGEKFSKFSDHWAPRVIAEMNDYQFKLVKIQGEFVWHEHADTDEVFIVLDGEMAIEFRDGRVDLGPGEMFVVPKAVEHKPVAESECRVMLIEPRGVVNTGDAGGGLTADNDVWV